MPLLTLPPAQGQPAHRAKALVFEDPASRALLRRIEQLAPSNVTILVTGETGTGKEIVARHIHALSERREGPFVAVNCGALTPSLVESELFGHERGAFTGATSARQGWFEAADGGTLFLDEVGDLPLAVQVKLLRVLQEREIVRVGSHKPQPLDLRLVAATNVDLHDAVVKGRFREDLFYRLNVATLLLPPLRERPGDIVPLARFFVAKLAERLGAGLPELTPAAEERLLEHAWPGNIRELENVIHQALLVATGQRVLPADLRLSPWARRRDTAGQASVFEGLERALGELFEAHVPELHARIEEVVFRTAYSFCHNNQLQTARLLGVSRNVVRARLLESGALSPAPRAAAARTPDDRGDADDPSPVPWTAAS